MREYPLIDSDAHVLEPPDLWKTRLPKKFLDRAPHQEHFPQGDAWIFEGVPDPITFGHNSLGGMPGGLKREQRNEWVSWENTPKGTWDAAARLKAMDEDGIGAAVLYPTPRIGNAISWDTKDREFHVALFQAYNNYLVDFSAIDRNRLGGIAMTPTTGIGDAVAELKRVSKLPGIRGVVLTRWPNGGLEITAEDDQFFAVAEAADLTVNIHVSFVTEGPASKSKMKASGDLRMMDAPGRARDLIYKGVFDRFPKLRVAFVEVDCGWVPYIAEQMDDRFRRMEDGARPKIKMTPSAYYKRNLFFTYITDSYAVENRRRIGIDNMMWSSDYPHTGTDFPRSWDTIEKDFKGVAADEKKQILRGNAARLYKLGVVK
ncbi:MAG: amidohydrolase [Dehalococcoidia bacterium]|nr:amidohydrolase [Dehalococcoidia bacterium]